MLFFTADSGFPAYFGEAPANFNELCKLNQFYADIAASIQQVTEEVLLSMARQLHKETGMKRLCIAGGVGLNSVANHRLLSETPFEEIFIQPAAGDGGGALGAALWADNMLLGHPRRFRMDHAYWGKGYSDSAVHEFLEQNSIPFQRVDDDDKLLDLAVDRLQQGNVIGWFQGRFEWGPRALGNRSIIADARNPAMKDIVNTKIKFREPYRPFAPSVLAERTEEFFQLPNAMHQYPARYMLYVVPVRPSKHSVLPAITHVDGTGRLQTVFRDASPRYHGLIERFAQATGVPAILNTSFNLKGEPIVNTPANAFSTFSRSEMDMLFLGNFVVEKDRLPQNLQQLQAEPVAAK
jgi:carbamoyltransferase